MGISIVGSSSSYDSCCGGNYSEVTGKTEYFNSTPDPKKFRIMSEENVGDFLIVEINYEDCKNYEGNKVLVYQGTSLQDLLKQAEGVGIDPHFAENKKYYSPIARFEPTDKGFEYAVSFCKSVSKK
jgi:hypothetical protein